MNRIVLIWLLVSLFDLSYSQQAFHVEPDFKSQDIEAYILLKDTALSLNEITYEGKKRLLKADLVIYNNSDKEQFYLFMFLV
jgi:hypothetical protein